MTNNQYHNSNFADVRKVPSPVKILEVTGNQVKGKLESPTLVDYNGIFKGKSYYIRRQRKQIKKLSLEKPNERAKPAPSFLAFKRRKCIPVNLFLD